MCLPAAVLDNASGSLMMRTANQSVVFNSFGRYFNHFVISIENDK